jgi:inosine/xanthosine triphosphate pyrophosphatase family protein
MELLIGTSNPAKYRRYQTIVRHFLQIDTYSLKDINMAITVIEDGATAEENARKKAQAYAALSNMPTLSIDEALTLPSLPLEEQPGVYVRRYAGKEATDEELLSLFLAKITPLPSHQRLALWTYALCLALPDGEAFSHQVQIQVQFADTPRLPLIPGYPLSSLMIDPILSKWLHDCTPEEEQQRLHRLYDAVHSLLQASLVAGVQR